MTNHDAIVGQIKFDDRGLVPAIAQDAEDGTVLMMAWMNADAVEETLSSGAVTYWSRSRNELWRKGATSGHIQMLKSFRLDCDGDTVLLLVDQTGPACHLNKRSCFARSAEVGQLQPVSEASFGEAK